jgi:iron-sulfur cluster repair protein YtfE (RIC family)
MSNSKPITSNLTVNQVVRLNPGSLRVFSAHGIDTCCGGEKPLAEVAIRHGLELSGLITELCAATSSCPD